MACTCTNVTYALKTMSNSLCEGNTGGIKNVWVALKCNVVATKSQDDANNYVATVTAADSQKTPKPFFEYAFRKNTSSFTSTLNSDQDNLTSYWVTELTMSFKKTEAAKRMSLMALVQNDCVAVVEDNNGIYWFLGFDEPLVATAGTHNSGTQRSDSNSYEITLSDESNEAPLTVNQWDGSLVSA